MVSWEPDLSKIGRQPILWKTFPDSWGKWSTGFIQSKCLKGMFYAIRQRRIMPFICAMEVSFL